MEESSALGKTILIVDDEPDLREVFEIEFGIHGFNVLTADGGNQALEVIKSNQVNAVLSDIRMPNGDGVELLKNINGLAGRKPLVYLLSGYTDYSLEEVTKLGARGLLTKPFDLAKISRLVGQAVAEENKING